jgi:hypothetical protein
MRRVSILTPKKFAPKCLLKEYVYMFYKRIKLKLQTLPTYLPASPCLFLVGTFTTGAFTIKLFTAVKSSIGLAPGPI